MELNVSREQALALLLKYNRESFHIQHSLTVEGVLRWFAVQTGNGADADFWGICGLLHDVDFENWPEQHCQKAPELLAEIGASADIVHAVCSHGWGICSKVEPTHPMEKILFAADELTGLIGATVLMLPSRDIQELQLKSLKKKFKDKKFAAKCNRELILRGCAMLGMELGEVAAVCIEGMKAHAEEIGLGPKTE